MTVYSFLDFLVIYISSYCLYTDIPTLADFSSAIFRVFYADEENGSNCMSENPFKKVIVCMFNPRLMLDKNFCCLRYLAFKNSCSLPSLLPGF